MPIGMSGLGRLGANMVRRPVGAGYGCVIFDGSPRAVEPLAGGKGDGLIEPSSSTLPAMIAARGDCALPARSLGRRAQRDPWQDGDGHGADPLSARRR
jgi:hypothetical protein